MRRLRVLVVLETLGRGGAEVGLTNLLPFLAKRVDIEVAALSAPDPLRPAIEAMGIPVHMLGAKPPLDFLVAGARLRALQRERGFDVMHAHLLRAELAQALVTRHRGKPARMVTFHNLGYDAFPAVSLKSRLRKIAHIVLSHTRNELSTAVAKASADSYARHLRLADVPITPLPIPPLATSPVDRAAVLSPLGIDPSRAVFVQVGRLAEEKRHEVSFAAMKELASHPRRPQLLVVGEGPMESQLKDLVRSSGLEGTVSMVGAVPNATILEIYAAVDAIVVSSRTEAFPIVVLESLALGRPLVATSVGGIPDMVRHGELATLVPPDDPSRLAEALRQVLSDPAAVAERAHRAQRVIRELYDPDVVADRWVAEYERICRPDDR